MPAYPLPDRERIAKKIKEEKITHLKKEIKKLEEDLRNRRYHS